MKNPLISLPLLFLIALLASCSSATYMTSIDIPTQTIEEAIGDAREDPLFVNGSLPEQWWVLFNDEQLNGFIQKALENYPTVQKAKMQILAAAYAASSVQSSLYPYLSWGTDVSRQKLSETGVIPFSSGPPGSGTPTVNVPTVPGRASRIPEYFTLYETELNVKYSFDFWEKHRNTFRAALGIVQANVAEEAFARLQLAFKVSDSYFKWQTCDKREAIAKSLVANRQRYLELIQKRVHLNLDDELSLQNARFNLDDAQDLLLLVQGELEMYRYQLKTYLADHFDDEIQPMAQMPLPQVPLPQDLPLHLISRRPDITAQLWLIESAGRQIDVAKAGFYPDFNLSAFFGFQTLHLGELFKWPSSYFNVDPAVSLPLFDGGRLMANLHGSEVNYDLAILDYNELVLNAAKEVLESLALLRNSWERLKSFEHKADAQQELYRLTSLRASHSLNTGLDELNSQANLLISQDQRVAAEGRTIHYILELIKALGGGYDSCEE
ncbi:MAG: efflux transporter outer membrane subunit [Parachlamydiaceae bacterium]